jgi:hypothetical protein
MSRKRLTLLALLLCVSPGALLAQNGGSVTTLSPQSGPKGPGADVEPAPLKLIFTYPCAFAYSDGKPYEERVMDFECDYMHASLKTADVSFNSMPTLPAQKAFLRSVRSDAEEAHTKYLEDTAAAIKKTDPAKLPKTLSQTERLKRIAALNIELSTSVFKAAAPFLWPPREGETYIEKTAGAWPQSWRPYIEPLRERARQLQGQLHDGEMALIDKTSADLQKTLKAKGLSKAIAGAKSPGGGAALGVVFDGTALRGELAVFALPPEPSLKTKSGASILGAVPIPLSDLRAEPPPIPESEHDRAQRNYFARGVAAGTARLKDDAAIAVWHAFGITSTIGDPYGKSQLIFRQEGPSCAVASQAEVLHARGKNVPVDQLAREGYDKGYYVDYETASGSRDGGTPWESVNSLLKDHGVNSSNVSDATPEDLDKAIRASPQHDAIVYVKVKMFWKDPDVPDSATHAVYLTGEEVEPSGKVRGYYINDTGQGESGRFISAADFNKVWLKQMVALHP